MRVVGQIVSLVLATLAAGPPPAPVVPTPPPAWTPDRVRAFVLHVEAEMEAVQMIQFPDVPELPPPPVRGYCRGEEIAVGIKKSLALSKIRAVVTGRAVACYAATYLGCEVGDWLVRPFSSNVGPELKPFKRANVKIIEQAADRVVADVAEAPAEIVSYGELSDTQENARPYTDAEAAAIKDVSRYTITRGADGAWRIADRKPSFAWVCDLK